jgi:Formate hydrogenlyase subunit 6/NADH:ubiquinone oxidoreductase 23 kD subunit (chain I)
MGMVYEIIRKESEMISIKSKYKCCGCNACVQICPKQCIKLLEDKEGFLYPHVDKSSCVKCKLCINACPIINRNEKRIPCKSFALINKNDTIRLESSSGGAFSLLAERVLKENGVVFGARLNPNNEVVHDYIESIESLHYFRGSKYVQSRIDDTYKQAKSFLNNDRQVLFSGTPCQIAGLKQYLGKEYVNLLMVDFVCHGVPSPKVWKLYIDSLLIRQIFQISFRNKKHGWRRYSLYIKKSKGDKVDELCEPLTENIYLKGFLSDLYLRPSCYKCKFRNFRSGSDMTIADFWGIERCLPEIDDNKGVSAVLIHTNNLLTIDENVILREVTYEDVLISNQAILYSPMKHYNRSRFFLNIDSINIKENILRNISHPRKQNLHKFILRSIRYLKKKLK